MSKRDIGDISLLQDRALDALAKYGYLTLKQMHRLKVGVIGNSRPELKLLQTWGYTDTVKYTDTDSVKHPYWHFLTPKGANLYTTRNPEVAIENLIFPKKKGDVAKRDYLHRVNFVETQISYNEWLNKHLFDHKIFYPYYQFLGSNRNQTLSGVSRAITKLELNDKTPLVPDGILMYEKDGKKRLFLLEVYRGDDTKKVLLKVDKICEGIKQGITAIHLGLEIPERGLFTFEEEGHMKATMQRILQSETYKKGLEDYLFFAMAKDVQTDFSKWVKLTGEEIDLGTV